MAEESIINNIQATRAAPSTHLPTPKDTGYFIADIISIASIAKELVNDKIEKDRIINYISAAFDKWLELVSPIEYIPGLVEKLDRVIEKPFWDVIGDVSEDLFERILVEAIVFKEEMNRNNDQVILEALAETLEVHTILLLEKLGNNPAKAREVFTEIIDSCTDPSEVLRKTISVLAVALTLSLNKNLPQNKGDTR